MPYDAFRRDPTHQNLNQVALLGALYLPKSRCYLMLYDFLDWPFHTHFCQKKLMLFDSMRLQTTYLLSHIPRLPLTVTAASNAHAHHSRGIHQVPHIPCIHHIRHIQSASCLNCVMIEQYPLLERLKHHELAGPSVSAINIAAAMTLNEITQAHVGASGLGFGQRRLDKWV